MTMTKGYWIAHVDVRNPEGYRQYGGMLPGILHKAGARFVIRGGQTDIVEGKSRSRIVVLEFPTYAAALACYRSPEYAKAIAVRQAATDADLLVIEGYDGVQPPLAASPPAAATAKGYWIGHIDVTNAEGYKAYTVADMAPFGKFGGRFLVRGGGRELPEGHLRSRSVLLEFPSYAAALACYRSPDYQAAKKFRDGNADADLLIVEGYDGAQP
jgi:uncharacterized protein (DUF1330 family)